MYMIMIYIGYIYISIVYMYLSGAQLGSINISSDFSNTAFAKKSLAN